ncbi:hypothetical protein [Planktotalea sp.]|uniref:hypothetical protein n=1 Tax=Planktotalea sp. TaxID=2029877 RepID=UPI003D6AE3C0
MSQVDDSAYRFSRSSRTPRALIIVALWWVVIALLGLVLNAAPIIIAVLALASLPALYDIGAGATSELNITDKDISWRSGRRSGTLARGQLKSVRLDTRLDLSLRMTLITHQGGKIRLPYECVPKANEIEAALKTAGITFERHHFTLLS